jgi:hypothetical protein
VADARTMPSEDKFYSTSSAKSRLVELACKTKRFAICERGSGQFEVIDNRHLLDQLLRLPELRPKTNDWIELEFDEALESLSSGPTLTNDDVGMLAWLTTTVEVLDPEGESVAFNAAYEGAIAFRGTPEQVEYILLAALNHRLLSFYGPRAKESLN